MKVRSAVCHRPFALLSMYCLASPGDSYINLESLGPAIAYRLRTFARINEVRDVRRRGVTGAGGSARERAREAN